MLTAARPPAAHTISAPGAACLAPGPPTPTPPPPDASGPAPLPHEPPRDAAAPPPDAGRPPAWPLARPLNWRATSDASRRACMTGVSLWLAQLTGNSATSDPATTMHPATNHMGPLKEPVAVESAPTTYGPAGRARGWGRAQVARAGALQMVSPAARAERRRLWGACARGRDRLAAGSCAPPGAIPVWLRYALTHKRPRLYARALSYTLTHEAADVGQHVDGGQPQRALAAAHE